MSTTTARTARAAAQGRASAGTATGTTAATGRSQASGRATTRRAEGRGARDDRYGAYVDGANALKIGYAEPELDDQVDDLAPAQPGRPATTPIVPRQRSRTRFEGDAVAAPLPLALPRAPFLVLIVALVVAGVVGVLVLNTKINENAFELDNLRAQQNALNQQEQQAKQLLADRESSGNLAAEAQRLGLVPADTPVFITLPNGQTLTVPQPGQHTASAAGASASGQ